MERVEGEGSNKWDLGSLGNRVLELLGMEVWLFSISCCFKNNEDGFV